MIPALELHAAPFPVLSALVWTPILAAILSVAASEATVAKGAGLLEEEARRQGLMLNIVLEVNSVHLIKRLVARGTYFTIASHPAVAAEIASGQLAVRRIVRPEIQQTFYLAIGGRRSPAAAVRVIADLVTRLAPSAALRVRRREAWISMRARRPRTSA